MNKDQIEVSWNQFAGKVKMQWGRLSDNDISLLQKNTQEFYKKLQDHYSVGLERAESYIRDFQISSNYCVSDKQFN